MRRLCVLAIPLIISLIAAAPPADAAGQARGKGKQKQEKEHKNGGVFRNDDRRIIHDYYRVNTNNLPPGLAKRNGDLPPGLEKQLRRNGHLPPGLEKRIEPFPVDLERRLPRLPPIYRRGILDDRAVIYDPATNAILDIFQLVR